MPAAVETLLALRPELIRVCRQVEPIVEWARSGVEPEFTFRLEHLSSAEIGSDFEEGYFDHMEE